MAFERLSLDKLLTLQTLFWTELLGSSRWDCYYILYYFLVLLVSEVFLKMALPLKRWRGREEEREKQQNQDFCCSSVFTSIDSMSSQTTWLSDIYWKTTITVIIGVKKKKTGERNKDQARFKTKQNKTEYIWFVSQVVMSIYNRYFVNKYIYWFTHKKRLQSHLRYCKTALRGDLIILSMKQTLRFP